MQVCVRAEHLGIYLAFGLGCGDVRLWVEVVSPLEYGFAVNIRARVWVRDRDRVRNRDWVKVCYDWGLMLVCPSETRFSLVKFV